MNKPIIRFKEFSEEWEEHTLGDFGQISMCKRIFKNQTSPNGEIPFFKIGTFGYTPDAYISRKLYEEYRQLYSFPHKGDILISAAGTIGRTVEYMGEDAYFQDSNIVWLNHSNEIDNKFLKYLYSKTNWNNLEGATIKRLYNSILLSTKSNCPSLSEQQSIASFFTSLDSQIKAAGERIASLKRVKAASLQSMFPQEGETTPRLRFKGFTGDWQLVTLGELFKERTERNSNGEMLSVTMNSGIIKASENGRTDNSSEDKSNYKVVKVGDIAYNSMRMWQGASGCSQYEGIVSPAYTVIVPNENISSTFFAYYFKTSDVIKVFRLHSQGLTKDTWNLKYPMFSLIELYFPYNPLEQQKIADYFTNLDRQIALQSQRLEKLKQIKAACLYKMFV